MRLDHLLSRESDVQSKAGPLVNGQGNKFQYCSILRDPDASESMIRNRARRDAAGGEAKAKPDLPDRPPNRWLDGSRFCGGYLKKA